MVAMPERVEEKPVEASQELEVGELPSAAEMGENVSQVTQLQATSHQQVQQQSQPAITTAPTTTLQVPADDQNVLVALSKGKVTESITWLASFWIRMIKKAIKMGSQIIFGKG